MLHHPIRKVWSELGLGHLLISISAQREWHRWGGYSPSSSLKCGEARAMTIEINGMAHVILTVSRFDVARDFYRKLLPQFGMKPVFDGDKFFYCVGGRMAIGIEPCDAALASDLFKQQHVGLHHLCLRARSRENVDRCARRLKAMYAI